MPEDKTSTPETYPAYILHDLPAREDALDFTPYVDTLAGIIASSSTRTPLTVGLFGTWGSGKTSLMRMVQNTLPQDFLTVWFDPWKFEREETLWRALLLKVLKALRRAVPDDKSPASRNALNELTDLETALYRTTDREEAGGIQIDWSKIASGLGKGALTVGLSFIPGGTLLADLIKKTPDKGLDVEETVETLMAAIQRERSKIRIEHVQFLDQFQERFESLVETHVKARQRRLIVFVDDLDRCLPERAIEVLEAIKLFLDVPECVFILGLDQEVIARGIEIKYREFGLSGDTPAAEQRRFLIEGARYLEKIIQLPFQIPPIERTKVSDFVHGLVDEWPHEAVPQVFAEGLGENPRQIKRTVNVFLLLWQLTQKRRARPIKPVRLAKVVAIQHIHPELYEVLKITPRLLRDLERYHRDAAASGRGVEGREGGRPVEAPPALEPYIHHAKVRRLLTLHPEDMPDVNFIGLAPDELRLYFTLTRRAEAPQAAPAEPPRAVFEPETVPIPAGPFLMGSADDDPDAEDIEKPQHTVTLADYRIGRYPVTNAEYQAFVEDARHPAPWDWENDTYPHDKGDHPVVNISWHDALAYCQWLSEKSGKRYLLPSEAQWEKAARGDDARIYPWGNDWDAQKANCEEGGPKTTTPVGQYSPAGDSPYGIADMAGNVWEWTRSLWGKELKKNLDFGYPYDPKDSGREDLKAGNEVRRVLCGGAFGNARRSVRCAVRYGYGPYDRSGRVGFRVVLSSFSSDL